MYRIKRIGRVFGISLVVSSIFLSSACADDAMLDEYIDMSLEDLLDVTVTSASGREQKQMEVSQAMTVLTREDIERSGARSIQDLFYRVPGMIIRQKTGSSYSVSTRTIPGGGVISSDMLVLIDGISVFDSNGNYTPWFAIPINLHEIERIEVIRGSGGLLYSSHAVSGVINLITKSAQESDQNNYVSVQVGNRGYTKESIAMTMAPIDGHNFFIRGFYEHDRDDVGFRKSSAGIGKKNDDMRRHHFGLRLDYEPSEKTKLMAEWRANYMRMDFPGILGTGASAKHMNWIHMGTLFLEHKATDFYDFHLRCGYAGYTQAITVTDDSNIDTVTLNLQNNVKYNLFGQHVLSCGVDWVLNEINAIESIQTNSEQNQYIWSFFAQDEYRPIDSLIITGGVRVDHDSNNCYHNYFLWQPRASVVYMVSPKHSLRAVASRSLRSMSIVETNISIGGGAALASNGLYLKPEEVFTYEAGYRGLLLDDKLNVNMVGYLSNWHGHRVSYSTGGVPAALYSNNGDVRYYGIECEAKYKLSDHFSTFADYTYIVPDSRPAKGDNESETIVRGVPKHMIGAGLRYDWRGFKFDLYAKYVDSTETTNATSKTEVPEYFKTFFRIAYERDLSFTMPGSTKTTLEVELVANDLFDQRKVEFPNGYFITERVYGGIKIKF